MKNLNTINLFDINRLGDIRMKIIDIEIENKLIIKFNYKDRPFSMVVEIISKNNNYIIIPSILEKDLIVDPSTLSEVELIYTVKDGIFLFESTRFEISVYQGMRVYLVSSDEDINRINRREAYRVFIGELVKINVTTADGKKKNIEGILKNISVTGMGIISKHEFEIGSTISVIYGFEGIYFHLLGEVIRKDKINRYKAYSYGCLFKVPNNGINRVISQIQIRNKTERVG